MKCRSNPLLGIFQRQGSQNMALQTDEYEDLAGVFHSLGDKTRLSIVTLLAEGEMNVTTIQNALRLRQSSTSHHLNLLCIGGLVTARRQGRHIFYSLADLTKHRLGRNSELCRPGINAAKFGPAELVLPSR